MIETYTSPGLLAEFCSMVSRLFVAVLSAAIFPALAIDPVVSSASATRRRDMPHLTVVDEPIAN
jgi:hypothetical protein